MPRDSLVGPSRRWGWGATGPMCALPQHYRIEGPHASQIPTRRAEYSLTETARPPFQSEPEHTCFWESTHESSKNQRP